MDLYQGCWQDRSLGSDEYVLSADEKERAEHVMLVDLGRNAAKALPLYDKACAGGHKPACERARKLRE